MSSLVRFCLTVACLCVLATLSFVVADTPGGPSSEPDVVAKLALLRQKFDFHPIPQEGGYYFSTYHSDLTVRGAEPGTLPRLAGSAIYFLMGPGDFSALHRLKEDEIYHYYTGSPIELLQLFPDGTGSVTICGPEFWNGQQPQVVIKKGTWQGSHPLDVRSFSLLGTTMTPGFTPVDFALGKREDLLKAYPKFADKIKELTRQ
jgi:predicted cupin superfamily sugar epimerase